MPWLSRFIGTLVAGVVLSTASAQVYVPDVAYNGGEYIVDTFTRPASFFVQGRRIVRLAGGDTIVAALVPRSDQRAYAVGLVRYDSTGRHRPWTSPGIYGTPGNRYVIYDRPGSTRHVTDIKDMVVWKDTVFVLVNVIITSGPMLQDPTFVLPADVVDLLIFRTTGEFVSITQLVPTVPRAVFGELHLAGGIAVYLPNPSTGTGLNLVYAGTRNPIAWEGRPEFLRFSVSDTGTLTRLAMAHPDPAGVCSVGIGSCEIHSIALGGRPSPTQPPRIYLGGARRTTSTDRDFVAMQIDHHGRPVPTFGNEGGSLVDFGLGELDDIGRALAVTRSADGINDDVIYLAGEVGGRCGYGLGIVSLRANGLPDPAFGPDGTGRRSWFAPDATPEVRPCRGPNSLIRLRRGGLVLRDGVLALATQRERGPPYPGARPNIDGLLSRVDAITGDVLTNTLVPYRRAGVYTRESGFTDLVVDGADGYVATGSTRLFETEPPTIYSGVTQAATVRLKPLSAPVTAVQ